MRLIGVVREQSNGILFIFIVLYSEINIIRIIKLKSFLIFSFALLKKQKPYFLLFAVPHSFVFCDLVSQTSKHYSVNNLTAASDRKNKSLKQSFHCLHSLLDIHFAEYPSALQKELP